MTMVFDGVHAKRCDGVCLARIHTGVFVDAIGVKQSSSCLIPSWPIWAT